MSLSDGSPDRSANVIRVLPCVQTGARRCERAPFNPLQAQEVAEAFNGAGVEYLFIGKGSAILLGYPGTTQDVDVFPAKSRQKGSRMITAILGLGFVLDDETKSQIIL